jgi:hypothetical protein
MAHRTSLTPRRCWAIAVTMPSLPVVEIIATASFLSGDLIGDRNYFQNQNESINNRCSIN